MKKPNKQGGFVTLPIALGVIIFGLASLSVYLLYSKVVSKNTTSIQQEPLIEEDDNVATSTVHVKTDVVPVEKTVDSPKKPVVSLVSNTLWAAYYDELISLENEFHSDFDFINWNVSLNTTNTSLQKKSAVGALETAQRVKAKVVEGKTKFPSQLICLNKEQEAFNGFDLALNNSITFFDYSMYLLKFDEINTSIQNKAGVIDLRLKNEEYDKAADTINEVLALLIDVRLVASKANGVINLSAMDQYIKWNESYSAGIGELYQAIKNRYHASTLSTDFIALGEVRTSADLELANQIKDWSVTNLIKILTDAGKAYTQSNNLCSKD